MSEKTLYINMLGAFSIKNEYHQFTHLNSKSLQITRLLAFLIAHKDNDVSKDTLIDILWPEENANNPSGALRNLIYRTRQMLCSFFPETDDAGLGENDVPECILVSKNSYRWNPDVDCIIDTQLYEHYLHLAGKESPGETQYTLHKKAHDLYSGDFLDLLAADEWVIFRSVYYRNLFTKITLDMCTFLNSNKDYSAVIKLCEISALMVQMDEKIHREKLNAYLQMKDPASALSYYHSVADLFTQRLGIDLSPDMKDLYQQITEQLSNPHQDIRGLEKNLQSGDTMTGTFYCNFDIFKNIYQVNLRAVRRSQSKRYLILYTLTDTNHPQVITSDLIEEMDLLCSFLVKNLRNNDVFTKSSPCQFSLILTVGNENGCRIAVNRIVERFMKRKKYKSTQLDVEYKLIQ